MKIGVRPGGVFGFQGPGGAGKTGLAVSQDRLHVPEELLAGHHVFWPLELHAPDSVPLPRHGRRRGSSRKPSPPLGSGRRVGPWLAGGVSPARERRRASLPAGPRAWASLRADLRDRGPTKSGSSLNVPWCSNTPWYTLSREMWKWSTCRLPSTRFKKCTSRNDS